MVIPLAKSMGESEAAAADGVAQPCKILRPEQQVDVLGRAGNAMDGQGHTAAECVIEAVRFKRSREIS